VYAESCINCRLFLGRNKFCRSGLICITTCADFFFLLWKWKMCHVRLRFQWSWLESAFHIRMGMIHAYIFECTSIYLSISVSYPITRWAFRVWKVWALQLVFFRWYVSLRLLLNIDFSSSWFNPVFDFTDSRDEEQSFDWCHLRDINSSQSSIQAGHSQTKKRPFR